MTSEITELTESGWHHHCTLCGNLFDAADLHAPCPQCGMVDRRESQSRDPYFNAYYGIQLPRDWRAILQEQN